jgi:membrane fusion protein (multidrug efflux system)
MLCLGLVALAACGKPPAPQQPPPPEVGVLTAHLQTAPLTKDLVGRLSSYRSADVRARVSGVLLKRVYKEGSDVKEGQLLFKIDPAPYQAALNASLADLASAKASYANYHATAERYRGLIGKSYVSKQDLDTAEANERTGAASVKQAQANVQTARINLGFTDVTSPIDGRASQQQVTEGALVGQGSIGTGSSATQTASTTLLTTIDQLDPLYVNFTLSSTDYNQMRSAQTDGNVTLNDQDQTHVQVTLPDGSKYDQEGTLDFSGATVNQSTGAISLRAILPNPQRSLLPGQYVNLTAKLGERQKVYLVPQQSIQRDTVGAYAMVVGADGKVSRKNVDADQAYGNQWVITKGLATGDQVVVSGLQQIKEGAPAKAAPWQQGQDKAAAAMGQAPAKSAAAQGGDKPAAKQ